MSLALIFISAGCSSDSDWNVAKNDNCYTGTVKYILDNGYIQAVITHDPDEATGVPTSPVVRGSEVSFNVEELPNAALQVGDTIEFKILFWKDNHISIGGDIGHFNCQVRPCK